MKKITDIYLGDKVKTKKSFKPLLKNDERFDPKGVQYDGIIVGKRGAFVLVDLKKTYPFTHHAGGMFATPTICAINLKDLTILETYKSDDKDEREFVGLMKEVRFEELQKLPLELHRIEDSCMQYAGTIKRLYNDMESTQRDLDKQEYTLKELKEKQAAAVLDTTHIANQYKQMKKNKKIKSVEIIDTDNGKCVLITTNDLTYTAPQRRMFDYNIGAFKILVPLNNGNDVRCINYKKHVRKFEKHHPCISNGGMCLGNAMNTEVRKLRATNNIINLAHLLINFLEEPNYGSPHISDEQFYSAQKVTINPTDQRDWFSSSYWSKHEAWDGKAYTEDQKKLSEKLMEKNGPLVEEQPASLVLCPDCENEFEMSEIRDNDGNCPECGHDLGIN